MCDLKEAREKGLQRYSAGRPCAQGHMAERYVSGNKCTQCLKEYHAAYRMKNGKERRFSAQGIVAAKRAVANGQMYYIGSKPCRNGHRLRFAKNNKCVACLKAYRERKKAK